MSSNLSVPRMLATERLEKSRALLRQAMSNKLYTQQSPGGQPSSPAWLTKFKSISVVTVLIEAISSWWIQHPLRVASLLTADTTRAIVQPLARRNPLGLALGALALGAVLAWVRPWRWILKPAIFAGLWPQLLSKSIAHLPLESWLSALGSMVWQKPAARSNNHDTPPCAQNLPVH